MASWRIELFGGLSCRRGDIVIQRFRTRKAASLLALLAIHSDRAYHREELIDLFWPEMDIEAGRTNLRQTLSCLRRALECDAGPILITDNSTVRLVPGAVTTDVSEFEIAQDMRSAVELYRGELLSGFYDEWILPERRRLELLYLNALHELQSLYARSGEPDKAIPYALATIRIDPRHEESHVSLMRLYAAIGDAAAVRRQFDELKKTLDDELGEQLSNATAALVGQLIEEAKANEARIAEAPHLESPWRPQPLWKRALFIGAACACLAIVATPLMRPQRSHASEATYEDRQLSDLQNLRTRRFRAGTAEERRAARQRHAEICVALAEKAWSCWYGRDEETWLRRFTESNEEIRTALRWLIDNDPEQALRLSGDLTRFWYVRSFPREGYRWLTDSLARGARTRTVARARALVGAAFLAPTYNAKAEAQCKEALAIFHDAGDQWGEAHTLRHLGFLACSRAEFAIAKSYYDRALAKFTSLKDDRGQAVTLLCISFVSTTTGGVSHSLAQQSASQSLDLFTKLQNPWGISMALHSMGLLEENVAKAKELIQQSAAAYPEANGISEKECEEQAIVATRNGDLGKARACLIREMQIARDRNNRMGVAYALELFVPRCPLGSLQAARVFGATEALNNQLGIVNGPRMKFLRNAMVASIGQSRFDSAAREGRQWSWEKAVDEASLLN